MPVNYSFSQGGLPGIISTTAGTEPFAVLNEVNGDGGISEAVRIYWAIKSLTITANADASFSLGPDVIYSHSVEYPGSTATWDTYTVRGSIVGTSTLNVADPTQYVEPPFRPSTAVSSTLPIILLGAATKVISPTFPEQANNSQLYIELRYISGRYRIYPSIQVTGRNQFTPAIPRRLNSVDFGFGTPSGDPNTDSQTGTVDILGYSFDYVCEARCGDAAGTATINSQSITITSSSW